MTAIVSALHIYPIKGCRGVASTSATVEARGLRYDRHWMLVHADTGAFLSQRSHPQMARMRVEVGAVGTLTIGYDDMTYALPFLPDRELTRRDVSVWAFTGDALDCGDAAAAFFSDALRIPVRLTRVPDDFSRRVKPEYAVTPDDGAGFADAFPMLLATEASLADLNMRLAAPVPMDRFRPNIVVSGDVAAWAEDSWQTVRLNNGAVFHSVKPCDRCSVTTIDQGSGAKMGAEPLATLATFRRNPQTGKVYFGVNLIPGVDSIARTISVGDSLSFG
ncbi:MAG: MOSC N-terminal beta barrel domain-containing protein [Akkermansiaceae bacterium]|nr:MOSC N-terminal beta barrel domain-containing protein [Armatimonadota bacterium]